MTGRAVVDRDVPVPMRDGVVLRADVWRPADDGDRHPVILQRTPYDKQLFDLAFVGMGLNPLRAVGAGYVVVVQDCRGRYMSGGTFEPFIQEYPDGADTLAWLRAQPWCDGRIGMYGGSYVGATQLMAAAAGGPDGPDAIVPNATGSDYWEGWTYQGGAFQLGFVQYWSMSGLAPDGVARLPVGEQAGPLATSAQLLEDPWAAFRRLPVTDLLGLERHMPYYLDWTARERQDEGWRAIAPSEHYHEMETPALHIGGWYDLFVAGTIENYVGLRRCAATQAARDAQRLLVGPWAHGNSTDIVGTVEFGPSSSMAAQDMTSIHLAFFDRHLRDGTGPYEAEPARVRLFLMGANAWIDAPDWPLPDVMDQRWTLHSNGDARTAAGDGSLAPDAPGLAEPADTFTYDPADPVPTAGGATFLPGLAVGFRGGAHDQREVELRPDVLVYSSEALHEDLDVVGAVRAELSFATDASLTDVTAKLVDVHPDGRAIIVCDGILDLRYREGLDIESGPLPDNQPTSVTIQLGPTAMRFLAGHRIRLEVSSSNLPRFARHTNTAVSRVAARWEDLRVAHQQLFHNVTHPSALLLPVRRVGTAP